LYERYIEYATAFVIGFRLLFRPSELKDIRKSDIIFDDTIQVLIRKSKTSDKLRVAQIEDSRIFQSNFTIKSLLERRLKNIKDNDPVVTTDLKNMLQQMHKEASLDYQKILGHSLRIGGVNNFSNQHLNLHHIKTIGAWKSDAVFAYLREKETCKLNVSQSMFHEGNKKLL
jgi:integrase